MELLAKLAYSDDLADSLYKAYNVASIIAPDLIPLPVGVKLKQLRFYSLNILSQLFLGLILLMGQVAFLLVQIWTFKICMQPSDHSFPNIYFSYTFRPSQRSRSASKINEKFPLSINLNFFNFTQQS